MYDSGNVSDERLLSDSGKVSATWLKCCLFKQQYLLIDENISLVLYNIIARVGV